MAIIGFLSFCTFMMATALTEERMNYDPESIDEENEDDEESNETENPENEQK